MLYALGGYHVLTCMHNKYRCKYTSGGYHNVMLTWMHTIARCNILNYIDCELQDTRNNVTVTNIDEFQALHCWSFSDLCTFVSLITFVVLVLK